MAYGLVLGGIRVFPLEEVLSTTLAGHLSAYYSVLYVLQAGGIVLGISCYYAQGKRSRFTERFLHFLDLVADLAEELANAPISKGKLNLPYAVMHQAANKEFLALSPIDKRRMDNAFRARIIWEYRAGEGYKGCRGRISRRRLTDLAKVYDDEFRESVLAKGLAPGKAGGKRLPDTLQDLLPGDAGKKGLGQGLDESLSAALKTGKTDGKPDQIWSPEWEQLAYVALADAGLLPSAQEAAIHNGCWVSEKVLDAYRLARYKVHSYKGELALADDQKA